MTRSDYPPPSSSCFNLVEHNADGEWKVVWDCGDVIFGISDYDLAKARREHQHKNPD